MSERILKIVFVLSLLIVLSLTGVFTSLEISKKVDSNEVNFNKFSKAKIDEKAQLVSNLNIIEDISTSSEKVVETKIVIPEIKKKVEGPTILLLSDLELDTNIKQFEAAKKWPIASITKLITAKIALDDIPVEAEIIFSKKAIETEGSFIPFIEGEKYSRDDVLRALLMSSNNDAAVALSEYIGEELFISKMNVFIANIGLIDTHFDDVSGLSVRNVSTANDLKSIAREIYFNDPIIFEITRLGTTTIREINSGRELNILNINQFSKSLDFMGGKTGYILESGQNLLAVFIRNNRLILSIVLNTEDRFKETEKLLNYIK